LLKLEGGGRLRSFCSRHRPYMLSVLPYQIFCRIDHFN
jgi:hypothetical protein